MFLVEGHKSVVEFAHSAYQIEAIYHTDDIDPKVLKLSQILNTNLISSSDLEKISSLKTPQQIIALVKIPEWPKLEQQELRQKFTLVLDGIQDPGNMGTIIRTADWFGIQHIICSEDTVDVYNPKVVQASMGSLARTNVFYTSLPETLNHLKLPVFFQIHFFVLPAFSWYKA